MRFNDSHGRGVYPRTLCGLEVKEVISNNWGGPWCSSQTLPAGKDVGISPKSFKFPALKSNDE